MLTPCILVCSLDANTGYCLGCGRTAAEIGAWMSYGDDERLEIMELLPARLARLERQSQEEARRPQPIRERSAV
ncbi:MULTISPECIES: DUF1289 domain-containing protein [Rhizobium]|uniref:DUF1289 domain-containing protein n=1 Tax=Rhizobium miluonense TaxID=411945 RepID=A0A1C3WYV3_9HYPH|nr:DUF1289 domain-containing protein [Rhizobium miluonense]SCB45173.1 hypothetical protein GA0061102_104740 [Rhizobium miluonense]